MLDGFAAEITLARIAAQELASRERMDGRDLDARRDGFRLFADFLQRMSGEAIFLPVAIFAQSAHMQTEQLADFRCDMAIMLEAGDTA